MQSISFHTSVLHAEQIRAKQMHPQVAFSANRKLWPNESPEPKPVTVRLGKENGMTRYQRVGGKLSTATALLAPRHYNGVKRFLVHLMRPVKKGYSPEPPRKIVAFAYLDDNSINRIIQSRHLAKGQERLKKNCLIDIQSGATKLSKREEAIVHLFFWGALKEPPEEA